MGLLDEVKRLKGGFSDQPDQAELDNTLLNQDTTALVSEPTATPAPVAAAAPTPPDLKFTDAFAAARKAGEKTFTWHGNSYTTKLKEEVDAPDIGGGSSNVAPVDDTRDIFGNVPEIDYRKSVPLTVRKGNEVEWLSQNRPDELARLQRLEAAQATDDTKRLSSEYKAQIASQPQQGTSATLGENLATGTAAVGEALMNIPGAVQRVVDGAKDLADDAGRKMGVPEWMLERKFVGLDDLTTKPLAEGFTLGDQKFSGFNDIAAAYKDLASMAKTPEGNKESARIKALAQRAQSDALRGDFNALGEVLSDPNAWATVGGQALPFLAAAAATGGSLPALMSIEGGAAESELQAYEAQTGTRVDNIAAASAIIQRAGINGVLEKLGLSAVWGKMPGHVKAQVMDFAAKNLATRLTTRSGMAAYGAAGEFGTEALQKVNENAAAKFNYNENQALDEDVLLEGMGGGVGVARSPQGSMPPPQPETSSLR